MSLKNYCVERDKFVLDIEQINSELDFPCFLCQYRENTDRDEPCRTCDHNRNAVKGPWTERG